MRAAAAAARAIQEHWEPVVTEIISHVESHCDGYLPQLLFDDPVQGSEHGTLDVVLRCIPMRECKGPGDFIKRLGQIMEGDKVLDRYNNKLKQTECGSPFKAKIEGIPREEMEEVVRKINHKYYQIYKKPFVKIDRNVVNQNSTEATEGASHSWSAAVVLGVPAVEPEAEMPTNAESATQPSLTDKTLATLYDKLENLQLQGSCTCTKCWHCEMLEKYQEQIDALLAR